MQIVIDIPGEEYEKIINSEDCGLHRLTRAIAKGTPLPKGHGRIIDESQVTGTFTWDNGFIECYAPAIIEADKAESEDAE